MKVLFTRRFVEEVKNHGIYDRKTISQLVPFLEDIAARGAEKDSRAQRVRGAKEEIYVVKYRNLRVFLTKKKDNLVALSIMKH